MTSPVSEHGFVSDGGSRPRHSDGVVLLTESVPLYAPAPPEWQNVVRAARLIATVKGVRRDKLNVLADSVGIVAERILKK